MTAWRYTLPRPNTTRAKGTTQQAAKASSFPQSPMMPSAIHSMGAAQLRDSFTPAALAASSSSMPLRLKAK